DSNPDYLSANLGDSTFSTLNLNLMVFMDTTGKVIYAKAYDLTTEKEVTIPDTLLSEFTSDKMFRPEDSQAKPVVGILMDSKKPMILVSEPILTNSGTG